MRVAGALRGFAGFWVGFVIGDDWTVAAGVALGLAAAWGLTSAGVPAWWILPVVVVAVTVLSLRRAVARAGPAADDNRG